MEIRLIVPEARTCYDSGYRYRLNMKIREAVGALYNAAKQFAASDYLDSLRESGNPHSDMSHSDVRRMLRRHLVAEADAKNKSPNDPYSYHNVPYIVDVYGDHKAGHMVYAHEDKLFRRPYSAVSEGQTHNCTMGDATEVVPRTTYLDVGSGASDALMAAESCTSLDLVDPSAPPVSESTYAVRQFRQPAPPVTPPTTELTESAIDLVTEPTEDQLEVGLAESAVALDGSMRVKLISPGWGSSGYYPADVLRRDGPKVFTEGLKMYWNHQTAAEEHARPEGDLNDFAAVLTTPAQWMDKGTKGPGLYARAKAMKQYAESIDNLAPHIGVSIRANGVASPGEAEGRKGTVIKSLVNAKSVDFVTQAGRGGEILQLFEAARPKPTPTPTPTNSDPNSNPGDTDTMSQELKEALRKTNAKLALREAGDIVVTLIPTNTHPQTRDRLVHRLIGAAPTDEDGNLKAAEFKTYAEAEIKAEIDYIAKITKSGAVTGMGASSDFTGLQESGESGGGDDSDPNFKLEDVTKQMNEAFSAMGVSDAVAKVAANGR